jgi:N-acetylglutamate synthase-like GNAT family acetyltransferase
VTIDIRKWLPATDLDVLVGVSRAADGLFATAGVLLPPDDPTEELLRAEHVLVAGDPPIGFAVVNTVDGLAHLASLGVHPSHGRRGVGGTLLAAACAVTDLPAITLTTFVDVPWNAPWYATRGFTELPVDEWGPGLHRTWAAERAAGIAVAPRVAMIRRLSADQFVHPPQLPVGPRLVE